MAFNTLNRLKWTGRMGGCTITIVHRGAPGGLKAVNGADVVEVKKSYFTYQNCGRESFIPLHRVRTICCAGETLWKKKTAKG
jgi:uncharacterized protein